MNLNKIDLVILAGGRGTRINNLTKKIPKPMLKFEEIPFIKYLINYYSRFNFNKIYILSGYKSQIIKKYFNKIKRVNSIKIEVLREKKPLGTGGALFNLKKKKINDFLLINGDSYFEPTQIELRNMIKTRKICSILLIKNINYKENKTLSNLKIKKGKIMSDTGNFMNSGIYFFKKKILRKIKEKKLSLENDIVTKLINQKKVNIGQNNSDKFFLDIGTFKNYQLAKNKLHKSLVRPAIFLDRDGVINKLIPYIHTMNKFKIRKNIIKFFNFLNKKKIYIFIVTNQAGIGKGFFLEKTYLDFEKKIKNFFIKKNVYYHDVKYCPYHPKAVIKIYKKNSQYRKPGNFMIRDLLNEWPIFLKKSFMLGDKKSDQKAARSINLKFFFVENDILKQTKKILTELKIF